MSGLVRDLRAAPSTSSLQQRSATAAAAHTLAGAPLMRPISMHAGRAGLRGSVAGVAGIALAGVVLCRCYSRSS